MKKSVFNIIEKSLMGILAAVWLAFGVYTMGSDVILGMLMVFNGFVFGYYGLVCRSCSRTLRILLYVFVGVNLILAFVDQIGLYDWIVLVLYVLLAATMVYNDVKHNSVF